MTSYHKIAIKQAKEQFKLGKIKKISSHTFEWMNEW